MVKIFWLALVILIIIPFPIPVVESIFIRDQIENWYSALIRAPWSPPNWLFAPVWFVLYALMGISSYLVYHFGRLMAVKGKMPRKVKIAFIVYGVQSLLNWIWTPAFFNLHWLGFALIEIVILFVLAVSNVSVFYQVYKVSGYLMIPYCFWIAFATSLNFCAWLFNGQLFFGYVNMNTNNSTLNMNSTEQIMNMSMNATS